MGHGDTLRGQDGPRVASDVASRSIHAGQANPDVRDSCQITVPELPWPLRFYFVDAEEPDGKRRRVCVGFEIGEAILREDERDTDEYEVTQERVSILWEHFYRYMQQAEMRLVPTPRNLEEARRMRTATRRRKRERWTLDALALLVRDYRARAGQPGRITDLALLYDVHRTRINPLLKRAAKEGLISESELTLRR
jgi:hypothetical protein